MLSDKVGMSASSEFENDAEKSLFETVRCNYLIEPVQITRIYAGHGSRNWVVRSQNKSFFVKEFMSPEDLEKGEISIKVAMHCIDRGILSPSIVSNLRGQNITRAGDCGLTIFDYIEGDLKQDKFSERLMSESGANLADTHRALSTYSTPGEDETSEWLATDPADICVNVEDLLSRISDLPRMNEFDDISFRLLNERKRQLERYSELKSPIGDLTRSIIHGDYGQKNLIIDNDSRMWVIDFGDASIFLPAYELGRAAFPPENFEHKDWLRRGLSMVKSYGQNGFLSRQDLIFCARAWLVQLLQSVYGVKQHYITPHELQEDLDLFWIRRGKATAALFENLALVEESIAKIV